MDKFDEMVGIIDAGFEPFDVMNEKDAERQLMQFLNQRFPNVTMVPGHTSTGTRIDIVIEGTYAIELVTADNESRLVTLMHQIMESKWDFVRIAVIIVDLGKIPTEQIQGYVNEYQKLDIKTIVKQSNIGFEII